MPPFSYVISSPSPVRAKETKFRVIKDKMRAKNDKAHIKIPILYMDHCHSLMQLSTTSKVILTSAYFDIAWSLTTRPYESEWDMHFYG